MDGVRDAGRRRLIVVTAGVGVLAAGAATAVGATRPPPHHAARPLPTVAGSPPGDRDDPTGTATVPAAGPTGGQTVVPATPGPPMASSNGS